MINKETLEENLKQSMHKNYFLNEHQTRKTNKENIVTVALKCSQSSNEEMTLLNKSPTVQFFISSEELEEKCIST
jgi:hypothetical protein